MVDLSIVGDVLDNAPKNEEFYMAAAATSTAIAAKYRNQISERYGSNGDYSEE